MMLTQTKNNSFHFDVSSPKFARKGSSKYAQGYTIFKKISSSWPNCIENEIKDVCTCL